MAVTVLQVEALLFDAPPFDESKLSVVHLPCAFHDGSQPPMRRRYTLTHNDITGALLLTIGSIYNPSQLDGWYVKLLRCVSSAFCTSMPSCYAKLIIQNLLVCCCSL